jgi:hypothetical protein
MRLMAGTVQQGILGDPLGWECGWLSRLSRAAAWGKPLRARECESAVLLLASCFLLRCREWSGEIR